MHKKGDNNGNTQKIVSVKTFASSTLEGQQSLSRCQMKLNKKTVIQILPH